MLNDNQLETVGPGGADPGGPDVCGGCAGVYRHRGGGLGRREFVNWLAALSAGAFGFVTAVLLALTGLPEVDETEG